MNQERYKKEDLGGRALPPGIYYDQKRNRYTVDVLKTIDRKRVHIHKGGYLSLSDAKQGMANQIEVKACYIRSQGQCEMEFGRFYKKFIEYRSRHVRESSISQARTVYHKYFKEQEHLPLSAVFSPSNIEAIYISIINDDHLCSSWKNRIIGVLRQIGEYASRNHWISGDAYQSILNTLENILEYRRKKEKAVWNEEEQKRFLSVIEDSTHKVMFSLFIELGARISEFLGLTWDAYDARRGIIHIEKQLMHMSQKTFVLSNILKTKESYRSCRLSRSLREMLNTYKKEKSGNSPYLFSSTVNPELPLSKAAFRRLFDHYIELSGVKRITPHGIRHMRASRLLKACKNMLEVKAVASYMGHSMSTLLNVYSHSEEGMMDRILKRLSKSETYGNCGDFEG